VSLASQWYRFCHLAFDELSVGDSVLLRLSLLFLLDQFGLLLPLPHLVDVVAVRLRFSILALLLLRDLLLQIVKHLEVLLSLLDFGLLVLLAGGFILLKAFLDVISLGFLY